MPQWYVFKTTNKAIEYFCKNRDILAMKRPNEDINGKVYRDKVAPSELWASITLVTSLVNFYLVGLCTESDSTPQ